MKIKELLSDESKWSKGYTARNINGECIDFNSLSAVKFCLLGAVFKCYKSEYDISFAKIKICEIISKSINYPIITDFSKIIVDFNDGPAQFEDIRKVLELADV